MRPINITCHHVSWYLGNHSNIHWLVPSIQRSHDMKTILFKCGFRHPERILLMVLNVYSSVLRHYYREHIWKPRLVQISVLLQFISRTADFYESTGPGTVSMITLDTGMRAEKRRFKFPMCVYAIGLSTFLFRWQYLHQIWSMFLPWDLHIGMVFLLINLESHLKIKLCLSYTNIELRHTQIVDYILVEGRRNTYYNVCFEICVFWRYLYVQGHLAPLLSQ
jgi:hypothetical protein